MEYVKCKIVILPTEKDNCILRSTNTKALYQFKEKNKLGSFNRFHLYLLSDEEIKVNDFYIDLFVSERERKVKVHTKERHLKNHMKDYRFGYCKKIIATTDESLKIELPSYTEHKNITSLPRPTNEFLKRYCELGGVDEVLIEYEEYTETKYSSDIDISIPAIKLKVAPDNTITIKLIEEKMYSQEEVENLIRNAVAESHDWSGENNDIHSIGVIEKRFLNDWIKENLK